MAESKTVRAETEAVKAAREEIFIPKGQANDDPNYFVSINGVNYLLPRGKTSKVPPEVAYEIRRSMRAQEKMDERIDEMLESASK